MGVKGLWKLLGPVGRPIQLETLENTPLAIDSSIWIYQFQATMRDKASGRALVNAHVLGFLRRICKLLFNGIKPVFVFDGGAPALKRMTINERRRKKEGAAASHAQVAERLLAAQLRREAVKVAEEKKRKAQPKEVQTPGRAPVGPVILDETTVYLEDLESPTRVSPTKTATPLPPPPQESPAKKKWNEHDPYRLPELSPERLSKPTPSNAPLDPRLATEEELHDFIQESKASLPPSFDITSPSFRNLPTEVQYEVIGDLRLKSRQTSYKRLQSILKRSKTALDFSKAQIVGLKKRNELTQQLLDTTDAIAEWNERSDGRRKEKRDHHVKIPIRVAGERGREYVLVKNRDDSTGGIGWALGIRDEGTSDKPILIDPEEDVDDGDWEDIEQSDQLVPPSLSSIGHGRSPRKFKPSPNTLKNTKKANPAPLFAEEEEVEANDHALEQAIQESLDETEANELREVMELSRQSLLDDQINASLGEGSAGPSGSTRKPTASPSIEENGDAEDNDGEGFYIPLHRVPSRLDTALRFVYPNTTPRPEGRSTTGIGSSPHNSSIVGSIGSGSLGHRLFGKKTLLTDREREIQTPSKPPRPLEAANERVVEPLMIGSDDGEDDDDMEEVTVDAFSRPDQMALHGVSGSHEDMTVIPPMSPSTEENLGKSVRFQGSDITEEEAVQPPLPSTDGATITSATTPPLLVNESVTNSAALTFQSNDTEVVAVPIPEFPDGESTSTEETFGTSVLLSGTAKAGDQPSALSSVLPPGTVASKDDMEVELSPQVSLPFSRNAALPAPDSLQSIENVRTAGLAVDQTSTSPSLEITGNPDIQSQFLSGIDGDMDAPETLGAVDSEDEDLEPVDVSFQGSSPSIENLAISEDERDETLLRNNATTLSKEAISSEAEPWNTDGDEDGAEAQNPEEEWDAAQEINPVEEEGEFVRFASQIKGRNLADVRREIDEEILGLNQQRRLAMRDSEDITQSMISQIMVMLRLFGIPYMTAPMEAEAQCAELVSLGLVDGVITDDSDCFLFGGTKILKNLFNQSQTVEVFLASDLSRELDLERDKLIRLAYLLGSDYVDGLPGVGPVIAMEIMEEFEGSDGLHRFGDWWRKVQSGKDREEDMTQLKKRLKKKFKDLFLPEGWPNPLVRDAYLHPTVDSSEEPFKWGVPDLDGLRDFFRTELSWGQGKVDELLLPIIRKMGQRSKASATNKQSVLDPFVARGIGGESGPVFAPRRREAYASKRLQIIVSDFRRKQGSQSESQSQSNESSAGEGERADAAPSKKRKRAAPKAKTNGAPKRAPAKKAKGVTGRGKPSRRSNSKASPSPTVSGAESGSGGSDKDVDMNLEASAPLSVQLRPRPRVKPRPKVYISGDEDYSGMSE